MSRGLKRPSSSSALRVSSERPPPTRSSTWRAIQLGLLLLVVGLEALDRPAARVLRPELLVLARRVPADDRVGGVEDELGRAVVLLELDDGRTRLVPLEVEDVAQVRPAPAVDRLVVVADHAQVVVLRRERPDPQVLRLVRVLVLVDVEVAPLLPVAGQDVRRLLEEAHRLEQDVVEVERTDRPQARLVGPGEPGHDPLVVVEGDLLQAVGVEHLVLRPADRPEDGRRAELAGRGQVLLAEELLHQGLLVVRVVDDEARVEPDRGTVPAEDPGADRVERPGLDVVPRLPDERDDPLAELDRGPVREGHREDLPGPDALHADEVGDPVGEHPGLAAPGAGQDEQRPLGGHHRAGLLGVQPGDDLLGERGGRGGPLGRIDPGPYRRVGVRGGRGLILGGGDGGAGPVCGGALTAGARRPGIRSPEAARVVARGLLLERLGRRLERERDIVIGRLGEEPIGRFRHASIVVGAASPALTGSRRRGSPATGRLPIRERGTPRPGRPGVRRSSPPCRSRTARS